MTPYAACRGTEEHAEHMHVNDECPWCGAWRDDAGKVHLNPSAPTLGAP